MYLRETENNWKLATTKCPVITQNYTTVRHPLSTHHTLSHEHVD
jgi:hypothetical protein